MPSKTCRGSSSIRSRSGLSLVQRTLPPARSASPALRTRFAPERSITYRCGDRERGVTPIRRTNHYPWSEPRSPRPASHTYAARSVASRLCIKRASRKSQRTSLRILADRGRSREPTTPRPHRTPSRRGLRRLSLFPAQDQTQGKARTGVPTSPLTLPWKAHLRQTSNVASPPSGVTRSRNLYVPHSSRLGPSPIVPVTRADDLGLATSSGL